MVSEAAFALQQTGTSTGERHNALLEQLGSAQSQPWTREESPDVAEEKRRSVLEELDAGKISADDAMRILRGEES